MYTDGIRYSSGAQEEGRRTEPGMAVFTNEDLQKPLFTVSFSRNISSFLPECWRRVYLWSLRRRSFWSLETFLVSAEMTDGISLGWPWRQDDTRRPTKMPRTRGSAGWGSPQDVAWRRRHLVRLFCEEEQVLNTIVSSFWEFKHKKIEICENINSILF